MKSIAIAIVMGILLAGCAAKPQARVTHVVVCWLKNPGNELERQKLIDEAEKLRSIPGMTLVTAGRVMPSTRPVVDSSYDVAFVMNFADEAALAAYEVHPVHKKAVSEVLRPLTAKTQVYDIKRGEARVTKR